MKTRTQLGLIFLLIFGILLAIVYIDIYFIEPISSVLSTPSLIMLIISLIFGVTGLILTFWTQIKEDLFWWMKVRCKHCGNRNRSSALHCDRCGKQL